MNLLDPLAFAVAACRTAAPDDVTVESRPQVDAANIFPLAIVQTTSPSTVRNGPLGAASRLTISVSVYDDGADDSRASEIARTMFGGLVQAWREHARLEHGEFVHISNDSQMPSRFPASLEADNVHRWNFTINCIVRPL